jgi:hypothetical protein
MYMFFVFAAHHVYLGALQDDLQDDPQDVLQKILNALSLRYWFLQILPPEIRVLLAGIAAAEDLSPQLSHTFSFFQGL